MVVWKCYCVEFIWQSWSIHQQTLESSKIINTLYTVNRCRCGCSITEIILNKILLLKIWQIWERLWSLQCYENIIEIEFCISYLSQVCCWRNCWGRFVTLGAWWANPALLHFALEAAVALNCVAIVTLLASLNDSISTDWGVIRLVDFGANWRLSLTSVSILNSTSIGASLPLCCAKITLLISSNKPITTDSLALLCLHKIPLGTDADISLRRAVRRTYKRHTRIALQCIASLTYTLPSLCHKHLISTFTNRITYPIDKLFSLRTNTSFCLSIILRTNWTRLTNSTIYSYEIYLTFTWISIVLRVWVSTSRLFVEVWNFINKLSGSFNLVLRRRGRERDTNSTLFKESNLANTFVPRPVHVIRITR